MTEKTKRPPAPPCPACKSARVRPIVYGDPGPDLWAAMERGEIVLGGCFVHGDERDPKWTCMDCKALLTKDGTVMRGAE